MPIASRASMALVTLTEFLLTVRVGDLLPPRHELANRGRRGHRNTRASVRHFDLLRRHRSGQRSPPGTKVARIDYGALWRFAGRSILRGQLPLNLSVEMEAIEVALGSAFNSRGLEVSLVYREGAGRRVAAIARSLGDFAVMSRNAFDTLSGGFSAVYGFGPASYYGTIGLYRLRRTKPGRYVESGSTGSLGPPHHGDPRVSVRRDRRGPVPVDPATNHQPPPGCNCVVRRYASPCSVHDHVAGRAPER